MKKLPLALTTLAAFAGSASAADLPVRTYTKAPPPAVVAPNWTGFYVFGGAGAGIWSADSNTAIAGFLYLDCCHCHSGRRTEMARWIPGL
jgi:outer membrane immunogenic protein